MSWNSIFSWALHAAGNAAQQAAIQEIQKAAMNLDKTVAQHAPDFQAAASNAIQQAATAAVAGVMTRKF